MVFYRYREFSVTTKFAQACIATEILCRDRARGWDDKGMRDRAPLACDRAQQCALCARQRAVCAQLCTRQTYNSVL